MLLFLLLAVTMEWHQILDQWGPTGPGFGNLST